jgi:hypothetical protein
MGPEDAKAPRLHMIPAHTYNAHSPQPRHTPIVLGNELNIHSFHVHTQTTAKGTYMSIHTTPKAHRPSVYAHSTHRLQRCIHKNTQVQTHKCNPLSASTYLPNRVPILYVHKQYLSIQLHLPHHLEPPHKTPLIYIAHSKYISVSRPQTSL